MIKVVAKDLRPALLSDDAGSNKNLSEKGLKEETKPDRTGLATIHLRKVTSPCQRIAQNQKANTECRASCGSC